MRLARRAKAIAARVGPLLPARAGRVPYSAALLALEAALAAAFGRGRARAWPRNSFLTSNFVPGLSDLDVTVLFESEPSPAEWRRLARVLRALRRPFPWLGEANAYVASELSRLAPLGNRHELARDPRLASMLEPAPDLLPDRARTAAFLARMLERDAEGLELRPVARLGKWKEHLEAAGCPPPPEASALRDHVIGCLFDLLDGQAAERSSFLAAVVAHLGRAASGAEPDYARGSNPWLFSLFLHRYCGARPIPRLTAAQAALVLAQAAWECWGLASQRHELLAGASLEPHLGRLAGVLESLPDSPPLGPIRENLAWLLSACPLG
ncbi:MAG TPA: hypothetical protein VM598_05045 [Bdellovibrionota bacterium]|nr:hypothetical protein [Bdellovibrionota bacterium]